MDPNLFHLDWERTFEALAMIIVLAFFVERALAQIFETELFVIHLDRPGVKELIALAVSIAVCTVWKFDAISICILTDETTVAGYIITGGCRGRREQGINQAVPRCLKRQEHGVRPALRASRGRRRNESW